MQSRIHKNTHANFAPSGPACTMGYFVQYQGISTSRSESYGNLSMRYRGTVNPIKQVPDSGSNGVSHLTCDYKCKETWRWRGEKST